MNRVAPIGINVAIKAFPSVQRAVLTRDPYLGKLAGNFNGMAAPRMNHVLNVISNYHNFVAHRFKDMYSNLFQEERQNTSLQQYAEKLKSLRLTYDRLTPEEQRELHLAVVLHDIGYLRSDGWDHCLKSGLMVQEVVESAGIVIDAGNVAVIAGKHGLFNNFGVDTFLEDIKGLPRNMRRQIFILDCMDNTAKGKEQRSLLSVPLMTELEEIFAKGEQEAAPDWFVEFRLRHLLAPATFVRLTESQFGELKGTMRDVLGHRETFVVNMVGRNLRNKVFPVFQELYLKYGGQREVFLLMNELAESMVSAGSVKGQRGFDLRTDPDIFGLKPEERGKAITYLKEQLAIGKFDRSKDLMVIKSSGEIILNLYPS
ncbi:hypothetical protein ACFLZ2_04690 [Candidatus Margulisiibacteriota bacterium]